MAGSFLLEKSGRVATLIFNRPEKRNALSWDLLRDLDASLARIADDKSIRAVVIAARGPAFCSGHDLGEMVGQTPAAYRRVSGKREGNASHDHE